MKVLTIVVALLFVVQAVNGQTNDMEQTIASQAENEQTFYIKSRNYFAQNLKAGNKSEVARILLFFQQKYKDSTQLLSGDEYVLTHFWLARYDVIIEGVANKKKPFSQEFYRATYSGWNFSGYMGNYDILEFLVSDADNQRAQIEHSQLSPEYKDFLTLYLQTILDQQYRYGYRVGQEAIERLASVFVDTYPQSELALYVDEHIKYKYRFSRWSAGFSPFVNWGHYLADYNDYFGYGTGLCLGVEINYWRFKSYYKVQGGWGKTQREFYYEELWERKQKIISSMYEVDLGFSVVQRERFELTPYCGVSWLSVGKNEDTECDEQTLPTINSTNMVVGLSLDRAFYVTSTAAINDYYYTIQPRAAYVRLRMGYMLPNSGQLIDGKLLSAKALYVNVGYGFSFSPRSQRR